MHLVSTRSVDISVPLHLTSNRCSISAKKMLEDSRSNMKSSSHVTRDALKTKMGRYFGVHGRFCASHPWEVIVTTVTLTVCILSVSVLSDGKVGTLCGFNKPCQKKPPQEEKADTFLMIIVNSLAILYLYNQFSSLRKAGSKYLLGIVALFTIFASFVFGSGVVNTLDSKATGLNEALPFFLLLMDLSKATSLAEYASKARSKEEVRMKIGRGMSLLAPTLTLDTLVEVLIISIGTISGVRQLEVVCCFGCISLLANYMVFMTFFPASLALILEVCPHNPSNVTWHIDGLARDMQEEGDKKKSNPVIQRVKVIMALGLVVVHLHSRFLSQVTGVTLPFSSPSTSLAPPTDIEQTPEDLTMEQIPLNDYIVWKAFNLSTDQIVTIALAIVLLLKYTFYDKSIATPSSFTPPSSPLQDPSTQPHPSSRTRGDITSLYFRKRSITLDTIPEVNSAERLHPLNEIPAHHETTKRSYDSKNSVTATTSSTQTDAPLFEGSLATFSISKRDSLESSSDNEESLESLEKDDMCSQLPPRSVNECLKIYNTEDGFLVLTDDEILSLVKAKHIPAYKLETAVGNPQRGVAIRRKLVSELLPSVEAMDTLPYTDYDYQKVMGACCENVIGYMPLPVGVAGPLLLNGKEYQVPMATTEGCLVASTNRGCRALMTSGGVNSHVVGDGMTRGPVLRMPSAARASALKIWLDNRDNFEELQTIFNSTSGYARLMSTHNAVAGRLVFIRFRAETGDAMGMNMLSKGVEKCLTHLRVIFPDIDIVSISGNYCTDKKPSAMNWIEGRGKYVVCDAVIPAQVVEKVLKTSVEALLEVNTSKNLIGSAMAGSVGGFNAHAANIVAAIYIATGQDPAQVVGSSNCITILERAGSHNQDLYVSCTMPSLEVGTVGGGTFLPPQSACLKILGVNGSSGNPGENSTMLARIVCGTVLAGELSLLSALAAGHLVRSHMTMNRSRLSLPSVTEAVETSPPQHDRRKSVM